MALSLDEAIARVPHWAGASDLIATPLGGGITNNNFRIDVGGQSFVLRISGEDTDLLGISREHEHGALLAAAKLGIAPEVVYFIQPEGYLVTRFIDGRPVPPEELRQPENILRVMQTVRKIHTLPAIPGTFGAFRVIHEYAETARRYKVKLPRDYDWLARELRDAEIALLAHPFKACPCHNDLLNANFLADDERLYVLDWEYAGMGDAFFDLANFSSHHELSEEQDRWMLECYFDEDKVTQGQGARLRIMKVVSDMREASWGLVQIGISKLDFDFQGYADKFFGRAVEKIQNPLWEEWLKEVSKHV